MGVRESLQADYDRQERIRNDAKAEKEKLSKKADRVRTVRKYIGEYKDDLKDQRRAIKNKVKETAEWTGNTRNEFCSLSNDDVIKKYDAYISNVDVVYDRLCDLETDLERQIIGQDSIFKAAANAINKLWNEIQKLGE